MDLDAYRSQAQAFASELGREHYRHFAGLQETYAIEAIYDRHTALFDRAAVERLRAAGNRDLLRFAVEGHLGQATKDLDTELARREAELELEAAGRRLRFRESVPAQANEPDGDLRADIERARLDATRDALTPLARQALETHHALAVELGWGSYRAMWEELLGVDLAALERQTAAFAAATATTYPARLEPALRRSVGTDLAAARRSDLPRLFRQAEADAAFPPRRLLGSLRETLTGLGLAADGRGRIVLDIETRPTKSPRAFCVPARVPDEVYLAVPPVGGRDDYVALLHESGHAQHFAHVDPALPFERRHLADNAVTEAYAFLFDGLTEDPEWLRRRLGVEDDGELTAHAGAVRLLYLRRYGAKLAYELELHSGAPLDAMPELYARLLGNALGVPWPTEPWLIDVDPGFYAAAYLRAWALERTLREALIRRFGAAWFDEPGAGELLRGLWRESLLDADALSAHLGGGTLDVGDLATSFADDPA
jgi:hypothetical protein